MIQETRHIVLIGAARSGTKILRDSLAAATGAGAVPFDIGFVWGVAVPNAVDDVYDPNSLTPRHRAFIRQYIDRYASGQPTTVIEKTVGNTLRVPYVASVLSDAVFVHLVRDGFDVVESTFRQWQEPADIRYLRAKVRHFPLRMIPTYGRRYALSMMHRSWAGDGRVATWGPRYPGIDADLRDEGLLTVCARQWRTSVETATRDLDATRRPVLEVRYEDLVSRPAEVLADVASFCGLDVPTRALGEAAAKIHGGRSGVGARALDSRQRAVVDREIGQLLTSLRYPRPPEDLDAEGWSHGD